MFNIHRILMQENKDENSFASNFFYQNFVTHYNSRIIGEGSLYRQLIQRTNLSRPYPIFHVFSVNGIILSIALLRYQVQRFLFMFFFCVWDIARIMPELGSLLANNDRARSLGSLFWERPRSEGVIQFDAPFHILELEVPSGKWQRGEFVYLSWNVPI